MAKKKNNHKAKARGKQAYPAKMGGNGYGQVHAYTLADEARNTTGTRRVYQLRDPKLRHHPVTFVSGGFMDPLDFEISKEKPSSAQAGAAVVSSDVARDVIPESAASAALASSTIQLLAASIATGLEPIPVTDIQPIQDNNNKPDEQPDEQPGDQSDPDSDSSLEVILFRGRNAEPLPQQRTPAKPARTQPRSSGSTKPAGISLPVQLAKPIVTVAVASQPTAQAVELDYIPLDTNQRSQPTRHKSRSAEELDHIPLDTKPRNQSSRHKSRLNKESDDDDEDAAIIADYIANMRDDFDDDDENEQVGHPGLGSHSFNVLRDLGGTDSDAIPSEASSEGDSEDELDDDDEEDEEDEDGDDEEGGNGMTSQLEDDARLAQLIAKKEELGLGDDDVLLFDGADSFDVWNAAPSARRQKKGVSKKSRMFQSGSKFPSASRMADAFDELDLMDLQESRLKRSKKGRISFGLSDSELEDALNIAIKKDRLKKADKKKTREELRLQGLLGKNVDPQDLRVKYPTGMYIDELADEIEAFLLGAQEQLILPPLDKGARKVVHTVSNAFRIKSKSAGAGTGRHPILYRTKLTLRYDQDLLERTIYRMKRSWLPRVDVDEMLSRDAPDQAAARSGTRDLQRAGRLEARMGKRGRNALTFREGEKVGQDAAEIGADNRGRAMLEKMGWSKGMTLGNVESGGLIVPLTHVVKKTKAGLGEV